MAADSGRRGTRAYSVHLNIYPPTTFFEAFLAAFSGTPQAYRCLKSIAVELQNWLDLLSQEEGGLNGRGWMGAS